MSCGAFESVLYASGLRPKIVIDDGKWRRCATDDKPKHRNGVYVLHQDGRGYFKNYALDAGYNSWKDDSTNRAAARQVDHARIKAARDRERAYRLQAIKSANQYWAESRPLSRLHPYLAAKGLSPLGCKDLRENDGWLVVPILNKGYLVSVQSIAPDGTKSFWTGAPVKGGSFVIDRPGAALTCIVEGLATGLAVFQSVKHARVIVGFDAGNMAHAVENLKLSGSVVICADNDHKTAVKRGFNPGLQAAQAIAERIGCGVTYPTGIEGTDFDDYVREIGQGAAKRIERQVIGAAKYVL